jgi:hypothetical protein
VLPFEDRYTRQRQVREVGVLGQARIEALTTELPMDAAGAVAAVYLRRAGVKQLLDLPEPSLEQMLISPADVAAGCRLALQHLRAALAENNARSPSMEVT